MNVLLWLSALGGEWNFVANGLTETGKEDARTCSHDSVITHDRKPTISSKLQGREVSRQEFGVQRNDYDAREVSFSVAVGTRELD